jgi:hypothetical protein
MSWNCWSRASSKSEARCRGLRVPAAIVHQFLKNQPTQTDKTKIVKPQTSIPCNAIANCRRSVIFIATLLAGPAFGADTNLIWKAEATVKETYDSNIYLQDNAPTAANVAAARAAGFRPVEANKGSMVTTLTPKVGLDYKPGAAFNLSAAYSPEIALYTSAEDEDYVTHRGTLNFNGQVDQTAWELLNTATYIQGSRQGPTFARPDDIPAIGGIPLRDRRAAFIFRNGFRLTQTVGDWFFRPVASAYIHDFQTDQHYQASKTQFSYENYVDRQEISGGLDVGYDVGRKTFLVAGYRYGRQDQFTLPGAGGTTLHSTYGNAFHRILLGVEGSPASWLKLAVLAGPDIRRFDSGTPAGFNRNNMLVYWDASATVLPDQCDTLTLKSTRYEQPAFSSFSMYQDIKTDLAWRHKFNDQFSAQIGFTLYIGDWQQPVNRDDWIYTPSAALDYNFNKHLSTELSYSYDWVDSKVPASVEPLTDSHEFTRHLVSLAVKYTF